MLQTRIILIRRQVDPIEARMTLRELTLLTRLLNRESPRPIGSLQVFETINRNSRRARRELQEARFLLCVPAADALQFPESAYQQQGRVVLEGGAFTFQKF